MQLLVLLLKLCASRACCACANVAKCLVASLAGYRLQIVRKAGRSASAAHALRRAPEPRSLLAASSGAHFRVVSVVGACVLSDAADVTVSFADSMVLVDGRGAVMLAAVQKFLHRRNCVIVSVVDKQLHFMHDVRSLVWFRESMVQQLLCANETVCSFVCAVQLRRGCRGADAHWTDEAWLRLCYSDVGVSLVFIENKAALNLVREGADIGDEVRETVGGMATPASSVRGALCNSSEEYLWLAVDDETVLMVDAASRTMTFDAYYANYTYERMERGAVCVQITARTVDFAQVAEAALAFVSRVSGRLRATLNEARLACNERS